jgi:flagellar biosynthesis protein FliR
MRVSAFTEGLRPSEVGFSVSEGIDSSKQREETTIQRVMWMLAWLLLRGSEGGEVFVSPD